MSCSVFITVLLLSWPYGTEPGTNAGRLRQYIDNIARDGCTSLQGEVTRLRQQLIVVLGTIDTSIV